MRKGPALLPLVALALVACGTSASRPPIAGSGGSTDAGSTSSEGGPGTTDGGPLTADSGLADAGARSLVAFSTPNGVTVPSGYATATGTCAQLARDTSSCQPAREALGLTGNWLAFSCNVVEGLATSSQAATTSIASAAYVTLTSPSLPDHASNYYPTTGTYAFTAYGYDVTGPFDALNAPFSTYFPDPSSIQASTVTMYIPLSPAAASPESQAMNGMNGGAEGLAIDGVTIFDSAAGATDDIFAESGSFDECGGHPNNTTYHYHSEPYAISYDDDHLIGVMRDGFFLYGRRDSDGSTPGSLDAQTDAGSGEGNLLYVYGGHQGAAPSASDTNAFHYHLTEWKGCFDETIGPQGSKRSDDGQAYDPSGTFNQPAVSTCGGMWTDAWFLTGHGNGGTFMQVPTGLSTQNPAQTVPATRYFYGTPGPCDHCGGP
jgi:hypothetical protein